MWIEILITLAIIACWMLGGQIYGRIRDVPVPLLLAFCLAFRTTWWMFFAVAGFAQIIRLGYGRYDPENDPKPSLLASLTHDRKGYVIRAIWGFIVSTFIGGSLFFFGFLVLWKYILYIILNSFIGFSVSKFNFNVFF